MLGWLTGKDKQKKHDSNDKHVDKGASAPPEHKKPNLMEEQQLKYNYEQAYKLHIEKTHQQRINSMRKQTIYKDLIWSAVIVDLEKMHTVNDSNKSDDNDNQTISISTKNIDISTTIHKTDIDIDTEIEEHCMLLIESIKLNETEEKKERDEWMEQYRKKQELKQNLKETAHKTAEFGKFAWRKSIAFTTVATSKLLSATNTVLTKIEQSKKDKDNDSDEKNPPSYNPNMDPNGMELKEDNLYQDEGQSSNDKDKDKKKSHGQHTYEKAWGFLEKNIIDKYKKKKGDNDHNNDKTDPGTSSSSTFNPYD